MFAQPILEDESKGNTETHCIERSPSLYLLPKKFVMEIHLGMGFGVALGLGLGASSGALVTLPMA